MEPTDLRETMPALESSVYCNWGAGGPSPAESSRRPNQRSSTTSTRPRGGRDVSRSVRGLRRGASGRRRPARCRTERDRAHPEHDRRDQPSRGRVELERGRCRRSNRPRALRGDPAVAAPRARVRRRVRVLETSVASETQRADGDRAEQSRGNSASSRPLDDEVFQDSADHSSGQRPREEAVDENRRLDGGLEAVTAAAEDATLFCVSSLTWTHGTRLPIEAIVEAAHDAGALVLVDAVQSPGQVPVDVRGWGADFVVAAGHKWLLAPSVPAFCSSATASRRISSPQRSATGASRDANATDYRYAAGARRFEVGTASPAPHAGLTEAIAILEEIGIETIQRRIERLTDRLKEGVPDDRLLSPRSYESGLVTIAVDDPKRTVERLADREIVVRSLPNPDAIRASIPRGQQPSRRGRAARGARGRVLTAVGSSSVGGLPFRGRLERRRTARIDRHRCSRSCPAGTWMTCLPILRWS